MSPPKNTRSTLADDNAAPSSLDTETVPSTATDEEKTTTTAQDNEDKDHNEEDGAAEGLHALAHLLETAPSISADDTIKIESSSQVEAAFALLSASKEKPKPQKTPPLLKNAIAKGMAPMNNKVSSYWIEWPAGSGAYAHILARQNFPQRVILPRIPPMASLLYGKQFIENMLNLPDTLPSKRTDITLKQQIQSKGEGDEEAITIDEEEYKCQLVLFHKTKNSPINMTSMNAFFKDNELKVGDVLHLTPDGDGVVKVKVWKWNSPEGLEIKEQLSFDQKLEDRKMEETKNRKKKRHVPAVEDDEDDEDDEQRDVNIKRMREEILEKYNSIPAVQQWGNATNADGTTNTTITTITTDHMNAANTKEKKKEPSAAIAALSSSLSIFSQGNLWDNTQSPTTIPHHYTTTDGNNASNHHDDEQRQYELLTKGKEAFTHLETWYSDQHTIIEVAATSNIELSSLSTAQLKKLKQHALLEVRKMPVVNRLRSILNLVYVNKDGVPESVCDAATILHACLSDSKCMQAFMRECSVGVGNNNTMHNVHSIVNNNDVGGIFGADIGLSKLQQQQYGMDAVIHALDSARMMQNSIFGMGSDGMLTIQSTPAVPSAPMYNNYNYPNFDSAMNNSNNSDVDLKIKLQRMMEENAQSMQSLKEAMLKIEMLEKDEGEKN